MTLRRGVVVGALVVALVSVGALLLREAPTVLDKAIDALGDEKAFSTSTRAGQTVADISTDLGAEGERCRDQERTAARCDAVLSAAAFTAVTAVALLDCTAPDVFDTRRSLTTYLRSVRTFVERGATGSVPRIPKVVTC